MGVPKVNRLLKLLEMLQTGIAGHVQHLAQELQVSRRTVHRDLALLREAKFPLAFDERLQRYRLITPLQTARPPELAPDEIEAIAAIWSASQVPCDTNLYRAASRAVSKLVASLPPIDAFAAENWMLNRIDLPAQDSSLAGHWQKIATAMRDERPLRVTILRPAHAAATTKILNPRLHFISGKWTMMGHSTADRDTVSIPLEQIISAEVVDAEVIEPFCPAAAADEIGERDAGERDTVHDDTREHDSCDLSTASQVSMARVSKAK